MNALAHKIKRAFVYLSPGVAAPKPANDNVNRAALKAYLKASRAHAGDQYQPAGAKM